MALFIPVFLAAQAANRLGLLLDHLLFPGFRKIPVSAPVFIVGLPRSGTTFLHRLIAAHEDRFTTTRLWELLFAPSITQRLAIGAVAGFDRTLGRPLARLLNAAQRVALGPLDSIHATRLQDPEEDYLALVPIGACFLLSLPFPFDELWQLAWFDEAIPARERQRVMRYYRGIIQRHLYVRGPDKTYLSKNPSFSPMVGSLAAEFPDARFIACFRHPAEAVPSLLESMYTGARLFDNELRDHGYRDRLLAMLQHYAIHLLDALPAAPEGRHAHVTLERLGPAPRAAVGEIFNRFGWELPDEYDAWLRVQDEHARGYRSQHKYALEDFELDRGQLPALFGRVYERFGYRDS